jgi:hypothetical protein
MMRRSKTSPIRLGAADVEVVVQDLLEEDSPRDRAVEHLGQGELGLQNGQLIPVAGGLVLRGERVGQNLEPLAQQRLDVRRAQTVTDRLQGRHVIAGGKPVVQRLEPDLLLGRLPLRPLIAVNAQLRGVREIGAELDEERAEIGIHAVEIKEVDERRGAHQPGIAAPGPRVVATLGAPHSRLLLRPPDEQHPLVLGEGGEELLGEIVLPLTLREMDQLQAPGGDETVNVRDKRLGHRIHQRRGRILMTAVTDEKPRDPATVGQPWHPHVEIHPVDRLHLKTHVISKGIRGTAR